MAKFNSRGARLTALALATGTLVVAGTGSAGANPVAVPTVFGGTARGTAIHLEINLPQAVTLPNIGTITSLTQDISFTEGNTAKGIAPKPTSVAKAVLGNGNVVLLSNVLAKSVTSSLDGANSQNDSILSQDLGLIKVGVGQITSSVAPDTATSALTSTSTSSLASLKVGLAALPELPVKTDLNAVVDTLNSTVDGAESTLGAAVDNALATLDQATQGATAAVTEQVKAVKQQLTTTPTWSACRSSSPPRTSPARAPWSPPRRPRASAAWTSSAASCTSTRSRPSPCPPRTAPRARPRPTP
jgi:hypothetical protein